MMTISDIQKSYGSIHAAAGVSFDVRDGQITTLLGLNGSGKSTTLRAIAGTLRPDAGRVDIDGSDPARDLQSALGKIGVFPDRFGLYPRLTVREHLDHLAKLRGIDDRHHAIEIVSAQIGLEDILDRRTQGFSEGQRMRTGIAMALLHQPQNIVLDEPTRGLDILGVKRLRDLLKSLRSSGRAVLFSSHVLADVEQLADRIVVIHAGRVIATETPTALRGSASSLEDAVTALTGGVA